VMVITGLLLFSAIPLRSYQNIFFRTKMLLLIAAGLNIWLFHSGIYKKVWEWDLHAIPPKRAQIAGAVSLARALPWLAALVAPEHKQPLRPVALK